MNIKDITNDINFDYNGFNVKCKKSKDNIFNIYIEDSFVFLFKFKNEQDIIYKYNIDIDKINTVKNIIIIYKLCKELLSGQFVVENKISFKYKKTNENEKNIRSVEYMINYWEKLLELEQRLKINFNPHDIVIDKLANFTLNRLYSSIILNEPYRINNANIKTLIIQKEKLLLKEEEENLLKEKKNRECLIQQNHLQFGGKDILVYRVISIINFSILKIEYKKEINSQQEYLIYLNQYNDDMYLDEKIFLDEKDAYKYLDHIKESKKV